MTQASTYQTSVRVRVRETQALVDEPIYAARALSLLYHQRWGAWLVNLLCRRRWASRLYGWRMHQSASRALIAPLIRQFNIDVSEAELPIDAYDNFNAFFERRLKPGARPFPARPDRFGSPGDGKLLVFPELGRGTHLPVKGLNVTLAALLGDDAEAQRFGGGAALVLRLAPQDYHRFHFPVDGAASAAQPIDGMYHSVNPVALRQVPGLFGLNKRMVTICETVNFGRVAILEVGAIMIGTIVQTYTPGPVSVGQEKGHFRYGGSTIIVVFEADRIRFDEDLLRDSEAGVEVCVKAGEGIGASLAQASPSNGR